MIETLKIAIYVMAGILILYVILLDLFEKRIKKRWRHEKIVFWLCSTGVGMIVLLLFLGLFESV